MTSSDLVHHAALRFRINSHPVGVPDQGAGPDAQHKAAKRHVIELCRTAGHHERMMVGQRDHTGAELDIFRPFRSAGDEHFRTRDDLEPARMVLADPGFRVTQFVEIFEQPHIPLHRLRWVLLQIMEGRSQKMPYFMVSFGIRESAEFVMGSRVLGLG